MQTPKIPINEHSRLEALSRLNVLDTPPEERFDRVTRMAKRLFKVPIALVSLVDENRQWFKSCVGLDATETSRDISFCGHAILGDQTFYIPDTLEDDRFADNPLVTGPPFIRFYAGHPLSTPSGQKIGTLCIIDSVPLTMSEDDLMALADLAAMVEQEIAALELATVDDLTNISNRRGFNRLAKHSLNISQRENTPLSLAYFDIDSFKKINDLHGHIEGDRALKLFAKQLDVSFRKPDLCARLGGDEFVALLNNTHKLDAQDILKRFASELQSNLEKEKLPYDITFSCGIIAFDDNEHHNIDMLVNCADQAMYQAKAAR